ncbi:MAG: xanthine dehydrogenase family protein subunit M [Chloroflexi bacterium]|nr:xanthine dehydrogenase family protein subunit M [Chloroflexota bacterium]
MTIYPFEYFEPKELEEASSAFFEHGSEAAILAGGTDLLNMLKANILKPKVVINIKGVPGLSGIEEIDGELQLGTLTSIHDLETSKIIQENFPALSEAASFLGSIQIRFLATVGGNICRAAPSAETAPPLMAYDAQVYMYGPNGERSLPLKEFFSGPGQTVLAEGEILTKFKLPIPALRSGSAYLRHSIRQLMDLAIVNVAVSLTLDEDSETIKEARIVLGAVAPTPMHASAAEKELIGKPATLEIFEKAAQTAAQESKPISDVRSTQDYRRAMVQLFTRRALEKALPRAAQKN